MLYALASPLLFVVLVVSFLLAVTLHGLLQARLVAAAGDRSAAAELAGVGLPLRYVDPFGAVVALLGIGWGRTVPSEPRRCRSRARFDVAMLLPPLVLVGVGTALLTAFAASYGAALGTPSAVLRGGVDGVDVGPLVLLGSGTVFLLVGLLELVPIPPLDGGHVLFAHGGWSRGWQQARVWFLEQNWGVAVLLVLTLLPLGRQEPPVLFLLDQLARPFLTLAGLAA